jgi:hypothetical protein
VGEREREREGGDREREGDLDLDLHTEGNQAACHSGLSQEHFKDWAPASSPQPAYACTANPAQGLTGYINLKH